MHYQLDGLIFDLVERLNRIVIGNLRRKRLKREKVRRSLTLDATDLLRPRRHGSPRDRRPDLCRVANIALAEICKERNRNARSVESHHDREERNPWRAAERERHQWPIAQSLRPRRCRSLQNFRPNPWTAAEITKTENEVKRRERQGRPEKEEGEREEKVSATEGLLC